MDWFEFAVRVGLPTAALAAIAWFVAARVWPVVVNAWHEQQRERREEREKYLASLEKQGETFKGLLTAAERARVEERDKFLAALEKQRQETATARRNRGGQDKKV